MRIRGYEVLLAAHFTRQSQAFVVVVIALLLLPRLAAAQTATRNDPVDREFLNWARQDLHPIARV